MRFELSKTIVYRQYFRNKISSIYLVVENRRLSKFAYDSNTNTNTSVNE